jgi:folylpolyglutamate synthase/dihydropteroate synthase
VSALAAAQMLQSARVVATQLDVPRALPAAELAARWQALARSTVVTVVEDPSTALATAIANADGPVVVAGSLYLVGLARGLLVDDPMLRDTSAGVR